MKILALSYEYPPIGGGGGMVLKNMIQRLSPDEFSIILITTWFKNLPEFETNGNITIYRVKSNRTYDWKSNPIEMLSWAKFARIKAVELLNNISVDLILSNFVIPGGLVAYPLSKKYKIPYLCISHGHDIPWVKPFSLYPMFFATQWKIRKILQNSVGVITISNDLERNAKKFIGKNHQNLVHYIPNGCDHSIFKFKEKTKNELPQLLFVGRLVTQKGVDRLMEIALNLKKRINFNLIIAGDGPKRKSMEQFCLRHNLTSNCTFLGKVDHEDIVELYQKSDILIVPSVSEGMSLAVLEAVFSHLYVITTNVSGMNEIITHEEIGKIVINPISEFFANEVVYYLNNIKHSKLSVNNSSRIKLIDLYDWSTISTKYTNIIRNLPKQGCN